MSDLFEINEVIIERMTLDIEQVGSSDEIIIEQNRLDILTIQEQGLKGKKKDAYIYGALRKIEEKEKKKKKK